MQLEKNFAIAAIQKRNRLWGIFETCLITLLFILLGRVIRPHDPFFLTTPIPWTVFPPVLCSLLYGIFNGTLSLSIVLACFLWKQPDALASLTAREYIAGISCITLVTGMFSSYWFSRILHIEHLNLYLRKHLEALSREYYLLRISHDRLEYAYIVKPISVRDVFEEIQKLMKQNPESLSPESVQKLLGLFAQFCSINSAAFCTHDVTTSSLQAVAFLGKSFDIDNQDPLLKKALSHQAPAYIGISQLESQHKSAYVAAIPLFDDQMVLIGCIIIQNMPFWALTHDNLEILSVFSGYYASQFSAIKINQTLLKAYPSCPIFFSQELEQLTQLKRHYRINSALTCLVIPEIPAQSNILYQLEQQKRSLDSIWILPSTTLKGKSVAFFFTLMPLTDLAGMKGYQNRLENWLKLEFSQSINQNGFLFRSWLMTDQPPNEQVEQWIKEVRHAMD